MEDSHIDMVKQWVRDNLLSGEPAYLTFSSSWWYGAVSVELLEALQDELSDHGFIGPEIRAGSVYFLSASVLHSGCGPPQGASAAGGPSTGSSTGSATGSSSGSASGGGSSSGTGGSSSSGSGGGGGLPPGQGSPGTPSAKAAPAAASPTSTLLCKGCTPEKWVGSHPTSPLCKLEDYRSGSEPCIRATMTAGHPECPTCTFEGRVDLKVCCHSGSPGRLCAKLEGLAFSCNAANEDLYLLKLGTLVTSVQDDSQVPQALQLCLKHSEEAAQPQPRFRDLEPAHVMVEKHFSEKYSLWSAEIAPKATQSGGEAGKATWTQGNREATHYQKGEEVALVTCRECNAAAPGTTLLVQRNAVATFLAGSASVSAHCASFDDPDDPILLKRKLELPNPDVRIDFQVTLEAWQPPSYRGVEAIFHKKPIKDKQLEKHAKSWVIKQRAPTKGHARIIDLGGFSIHPQQPGSPGPPAPLTP